MADKQTVNLQGVLSYVTPAEGLKSTYIFVVLNEESRAKLSHIYSNYHITISNYKLRQPLKVKIPRGMAPDVPGLEYIFRLSINMRNLGGSAADSSRKYISFTLVEAIKK